MKRFSVHKRAQKLRKRGTKWEQITQVALRRHHINFLFQYVYKPYIVDFLLYDRDVILEIDGRQHARAQAYDAARTRSLPLPVVRWADTDVTTKLPELIADLKQAYPVVNSTPPDLTYGHGLFG